MIRPATPFDLVLVIVTMVFFSSGFVAIKAGVEGIGPMWLTALRCGLALAAMVPIALIWRSPLRLDRSTWLLIFVICMLNIVVPYVLTARAAREITAGEISLIIGITPLFALIGSHFGTRDDKFSVSKLIGIGLGICGVLLVVGRDAVLGLGSSVQAQGETLISAVSFAMSGVLFRRLDDVPILPLTAVLFTLATPVLVAAAYLLEGPPPDPGLLGQDTLFAVLWLGIVPTVFGYLLRYRLIRTVGYSYVALGVNLVPAIGVVLGAVVLGEAITWWVAAAVALVLAGLFIARLKVGQGARSAARAG